MKAEKWEYLRTASYPITRAGVLHYLKPAQQKNLWASGSRQEKLDYALRQCDIFLKWLSETGDTFFKEQHDKWYTAFKQIK